ncbi:MAG TPA: MarR family transcriptional regulator [Kofleriaceae bacterium]|jgi:DNA-binding MarR family transcriptional regulator
MPAQPTSRVKPIGDTLLFMHSLWELTHALQVASKRMARSIGVTGPQRLVIRILGQSPGLSAREIATTLGIHPSTLTGVLARLELGGFIERSVDATDRRRARFDLTPHGARVDKEKRGTVEAAVKRALIAGGTQAVARSTELLALIVTELHRDTE